MPSAVSGHSHRPTTKVNNKGFKSKKATKSALRDQAKGTTPEQEAWVPKNTLIKADMLLFDFSRQGSQ